MTSMLVFQYRLISFFLCKEALMTFFLMLFLILFFGVLFNRLAKLIKIPSLVFYLLFGILLSFIDSKVSNDSCHLLDTGLMNISSYIRKIALIIILLKAGLSLNLEDLKKVGRPAVMMACVPASFEILAFFLFAPYILFRMLL